MSIPKCKYCGQLYATTALLNDHVQQNHAQNTQPDQVFTCRLCNQVLQSKDKLIEHLKFVHQNGKDAQKTPEQLNQPIKQKNKLITCKICEQLVPHDEIKSHNEMYHQAPKQTNILSQPSTTQVCYTIDDPEVLLQQMQTYFGLTRDQIINGNYSKSVLKSGQFKISVFMKNEFKDQIISVFKPDPKIEKPKKEHIEQSQPLKQNIQKKDDNQMNIVVKSAKGVLNHIEQVTKHKADKFVDGIAEITIIKPNQEKLVFKIKKGMEIIVRAAIQDYQINQKAKVEKPTINKQTIAPSQSIQQPELVNNTNSYVNNQQQTQINNNTSCYQPVQNRQITPPIAMNNKTFAPSQAIKQQPFVNNNTKYHGNPVQNRQVTPPGIQTQTAPNQYKITILLSSAPQGLPLQLYQHFLSTIGGISTIQQFPDQSIVILCSVLNYSNVIQIIKAIQVYGQPLQYNVEKM
ncbi:Zinc_finger C2H2-type [Hexamita inflata]|uniref:Zinc finger C2H2-type n=1 Tax=Hexamita inflata TaxID=28002 RepID=A0AA86TFJ7_9EUKA|nr:Zinc finger C2H2-type [Hexamita inflata]